MERKLESEWGRKHSELLFKMSAARHASKAYEDSTAARSGLAHPSSRRAASAGPHSGGSTGVAAAAAVAAAAHRASMPMPERRLRRPATAAPEVALPQPHAAVQAPPPPPAPALEAGFGFLKRPLSICHAHPHIQLSECVACGSDALLPRRHEASDPALRIGRGSTD